MDLARQTETLVTRPARWRRAAWWAVALLPLLALGEPWVAPLLGDAAACRSRFTAGEPLDPWGRPWRSATAGLHGQRLQPYSVGPNGADEAMVGDDIRVWDLRYTWARSLPLPLAALVWLLLATAPRAARRGVEALRVAALGAIPTTVAAWLLVARPDHPLLGLYARQEGHPVLPPLAGVLVSVAGAFLLGAVLLRLRRAGASPEA